MRIVVDINHPAHVHFFKNFIWEAKKMGHEIMITASDKDIAFQLLEYYGFEYVNVGSYGKRILEKAVNVPVIDYKMYKAVKGFKPEILMGIASARVAHVAMLIRGSRSYIFDDTDFATFQIMLYKHFADTICVPDCFLASRSSKHVDYKGYHELAYLHPNCFKADLSVLNEYGIKAGEKFFILRFVAWEATHDVGGKGFSIEGKIKIVNELSKYGRVIISSEKNVPEELKKYVLKIHPAKMHHLMAEASLYIGEGATMASEATVLGIPSIYINNLNNGDIGTIKDQSKYGLMYIPDEKKALERALEIVTNSEKYKEEYKQKRQKLLEDKIDVTPWILNLTLNPSMKAVNTGENKKRIIIDINHPAHVHFFKHFIWEAEKRGHEILITASHKDIAFELLDYYNLKYENLGSYGRSVIEKIFNLFLIDYKMLKIVRRFKPDMILGVASARAAHMSFIYRKIKSYIFDDTEHATGQRALYRYSATKIFVPDCFIGALDEKYERYKGYHELAYLHPEHFKADIKYLEETGIEKNERFFIVRFVAWEATHDIGKKGFSVAGKIKLINELAKHGRVIITSERNVPESLKKYCLSVHPAKMHHIMAFASLYIGEGATMASEAVILGIPSIYVNPLNMGYIIEQQKFGLYFLPEEKYAIEKAVEIASNSENFKKDMMEKQKAVLSEKIDVSCWMIDRILGK